MRPNYSYLLLFLLWLPLDSFSSVHWNQVSSHPSNARHRSSAFSIGNKGYFGGGHINSGVPVWHQDWWQYDPASDSWTQIADYGGGAHYHSSVFVIEEFGYVGCGENEMSLYTTEFWKYIPQVNIWEPIADFPGTPRRGAAGFSINNMGYVGCGQSDGGYEVDFFRFDPSVNTWYQVADFIGEARSSAVSFSYNGKGYVGTGHIWGDDVKDFYMYDPSTDSWTQKADVSDIDRQDATGFVLNGYGYIGTGNDVDASENYDDFWRYDFDTDTWTQVEDFEGAGRRYMVSFVINGTAYCGAGTDGTNLKDFWAYNPLLGIKEANSILVSVYPNPSVDLVQIQIPPENLNDSNLELVIINNLGQIVKTEYLINNNVTISKDDIGCGQFYFILKKGNMKLYSGDFTFING